MPHRINRFNLEFSRQPEAATEAQLAYGLRKAFGREYEGARALRAMYHVSANPDLGGAQRLSSTIGRNGTGNTASLTTSDQTKPDLAEC